jgi:uncharacterized cupredoxin-like copper-binding protein
MKKNLLFSLLIIFSLVLASCGGGGGVSKSIKVTMTDFQFNPDRFTIPAGQEITLSATNNGAITHDFIIIKQGADVGDTYDVEDEDKIYWKAEVAAGQNVSAVFTAPVEPGEYQIVCGIPGHYVAGMVATLVVVAE